MFLLDELNNAIVTENDNNLKTLSIANHAQRVSQHVKLNLLVIKQQRQYEPRGAIDWFAFFNDRRLIPVLSTKIKTLILDTDGVSGVDLSNAKYSTNPPKFSGICFNIGCERQEINL